MENKLSPLSRFGIPAAALVAGMVIGSAWMTSYNGHGEDAGWTGMILMLFIFPLLTAVSALVSAFARGTKVGNYAATTAVFFVGMIVGPWIIHLH